MPGSIMNPHLLIEHEDQLQIVVHAPLGAALPVGLQTRVPTDERARERELEPGSLGWLWHAGIITKLPRAEKP